MDTQITSKKCWSAGPPLVKRTSGPALGKIGPASGPAADQHSIKYLALKNISRTSKRTSKRTSTEKCWSTPGPAADQHSQHIDFIDAKKGQADQQADQHLDRLNANGISVLPVPDAGLVLLTDRYLPEQSRARLTLWCLQPERWGHLLRAVGWDSTRTAFLPRRVFFPAGMSCGTCGEWSAVNGAAWWCGTCAVTGQHRHIRTRCNVGR